jgi:hypothetical protein
MNVIELFESLKDIPTENKLYHRTKLSKLLLILTTGNLRGQMYWWSNKKDRNAPEIATGRKSTFTNIDKGFSDKYELSGGIGNVEFVLYKDRIKTIRKTRINNIAEYPISHKTIIDSDIEKIFDIPMGSPEINKIEGRIFRDYSKKVFDLNEKESFYRYLKSLFLLFNTKTEGRVIKMVYVDSLKSELGMLYKSLQNREGEERVETDGIPVSDKYMKIRILDGAKFSEISNFEADKLYSLINLKKDVFVRDANFDSFMKTYQGHK